ncbi:MAG: heme ABC transporter permease CcmC [Holosporales bacterium]|jgi:heme exporter protein C
MIFFYANPTRFFALKKYIVPWLWGIVVVAMGIGALWGLFFSPPDYQQNETVRIMYLHVPLAWMAMFCYAVLAISATLYLIHGHRLADLAAQALARVGIVMTALCLVTGSIWGKPTWGTWWVWDARLTSVLVLFLLYGAYLVMRGRGELGRSAAVLGVLGAINLPIIKFSVEWWNTLHQPASLSRFAAPAVHEEFLWPLLLCALGMIALVSALVLSWIEILYQQRRLARQRGIL